MDDLIYTGKAHAILQDGGREGFKKYGVPASGFMDIQNAVKANWLAGNPWNYPLIETYYTGFCLQTNKEVKLGIAGAATHIKIDGETYTTSETVVMQPGQELKIDTLGNGYITYVSIHGKYTGKISLESCSTYLTSDLGHPPLGNGQSIPFEVGSKSTGKRRLPDNWRRFIASDYKVRVIKGPECHFFNERSLNSFVTNAYEVTKNSSRMGYQLDGEKLERKEISEIDSVPVARGIIQINNAGMPIVLLSDAQTTGGYPRIGKVISADLDDFSQLTPGSKVRFEWIDLKRAQGLYLKYQDMLGVDR